MVPNTGVLSAALARGAVTAFRAVGAPTGADADVAETCRAGAAPGRLGAAEVEAVALGMTIETARPPAAARALEARSDGDGLRTAAPSSAKTLTRPDARWRPTWREVATGNLRRLRG
jgi:hypothetical protein